MADPDKTAAREPDYYDCRDSEELTWTEPDEAIESYLDSRGVLHPGMTEAEVLDALPETVTLKGYARMVISEGEIDNRAGDVLEGLLENLHVQYGNHDDGPDNATPAMNEAARAFVKAVVAEYEPWACEVVSEEEVDVEAWVREHCPDWLKDDTKEEAP